MVSTNWLGPRGHVLHYPIRGGELLNFLAIVERDDWQVEFVDRPRHDGRTGQRLSRLAPGRPGHHPEHRTPFKWALMVRGPMPQWSQGADHAARRRLPSDAAVHGAGRRHGDRGCLCDCGVLDKYFDDPATRVRALRRHSPGADVCRRAQIAREQGASLPPGARRSGRSRSVRSRRNGSKSSRATDSTGSTPTTPPRLRFDGCVARISLRSVGAFR